MNEKIILYEEQIFQSKTIQLDLLDQLKIAEDHLKDAEGKLSLSLHKIDELLKLVEQLENGQ